MNQLSKLKKIITVLARLIGFKFTDGKLDPNRLITAVWVFLIGTPIGLALFGTQFPIILLGLIILVSLLIINIDDVFKLSRV